MRTASLGQGLRRAFARNVQQEVYQRIVARYAPPDGDGVVQLTDLPNAAAGRLLVRPFCDGPPGSVFFMRVYGWAPVEPLEQDQTKQEWLWSLLTEWMCVSGTQPGPNLHTAFSDPTRTPGKLSSLDMQCDSLALVRGVLGLQGFINSNPPGSGLPAFAAFELYGPRYVSFDFVQAASPVAGVIGMNTFYARV